MIDQFTLMVREMATKVFKFKLSTGSVFGTLLILQAKQSFLLKTMQHNQPLLDHLEFLYPYEALLIRSQSLRSWNSASGLGSENIKIPPITDKTRNKWSILDFAQEKASNNNLFLSPEISREEEDLLYQLLFLQHQLVLINTNLWVLRCLAFFSFLW